MMTDLPALYPDNERSSFSCAVPRPVEGTGSPRAGRLRSPTFLKFIARDSAATARKKPFRRADVIQGASGPTAGAGVLYDIDEEDATVHRLDAESARPRS
jgi:hypothetical protein